MKFSFVISKLAIKDLDDIWVYTAKQWTNQQANKYTKEIFQTINKICINAELGKPIDHVKKGHRRVNVKSHMIVSKCRREIIYVDRTLHQKMDIEKNLNE